MVDFGLMIFRDELRKNRSSFGMWSSENDMEPSVHLVLKGKGFALSVVSHSMVN